MITKQTNNRVLETAKSLDERTRNNEQQSRVSISLTKSNNRVSETAKTTDTDAQESFGE